MNIKGEYLKIFSQNIPEEFDKAIYTIYNAFINKTQRINVTNCLNQQKIITDVGEYK